MENSLLSTIANQYGAFLCFKQRGENGNDPESRAEYFPVRISRIMNASIRPVVQAILVADHVYTDHATGKKLIAGVFHTIFLTEVPLSKNCSGAQQMPAPESGFQMGSPFAYLSIVNVRGQQKFVFRCVDLGTDTILFEAAIDTTANDPIAPVEITIPLPPLRATKPCTFAMEVLWKEELIGTYRIQVKSSGPASGKPPETTRDAS